MHARLHISVVFALTVLSACFSRKAAEESTTVEITEEPVYNPGDGSVQLTLTYTGIVRDMRKKEGCDFMIELDAGNGEKQYLEPLTLDEKYKVDGLEIKFNYTDSRRPSQCSVPSKPIVIDKIFD